MPTLPLQVVWLDGTERGVVNKPPFQLPSMADIRAIPLTGVRAVSTFSGCGGGCLGLRWAGVEVLWASEFIPAAAATYRANFPTTHLDTRDIRTVTGGDILTATGLKVGELDLLEGSPPCAAFSTSGKREEGWGKVRKYSDTKQRVDDLFFEYIRLLRELQPKAFMAENVAGLVRGVAKGVFLDVLREMKAAGYQVEARVLDAQWLGVPQARKRLFICGVRNDLARSPKFPDPLPYRYSLAEALPHIRAVKRSGFAHNWTPADAPAPTVTASDWNAGPTGYLSGGGFVEAETSISRFAIGREYDKLAPGAKSDKYLNLIRADAAKPAPTVTATAGQSGAAGVCHPTEKRKFSIAELKTVCGFPADFTLTGTFAQQWERLGRAVCPPVSKALAQTLTEVIR